MAVPERDRKYHRFPQKQKPEEWFEPLADDAVIGMRCIPVEKAGVYVPGGRAAYPSTVLMNVIPAQVAGVARIALVSPPPVSPYILAAAAELKIEEVYQVGGAQAIAALALRHRKHSPVDKIVGPGTSTSRWRKSSGLRRWWGSNSAGPSDVLIIADEDSDPALSPPTFWPVRSTTRSSSAILITDSREMVRKK